MKNTILLSSFLLIYPLALGTSFLYAIYGFFWKKKLTVADGYLAGGIISIGLAEISHLISGYLGWSFSACIRLLSVLFVVAAALLVFMAIMSWLIRVKIKGRNRKNQREKERRQYLTSAEYIVSLLWTLLFVACVARILVNSDFSLYKDLTPELTSTFLSTDRLFTVNPTTGGEYLVGAPSRFRILCLPTLYGALCSWFQIEVSVLSFRIMPVVILGVACVAYYTLARAFWPDSRLHRMVFQIVILVLFLVSDTCEGQAGFLLFHQGFSPQTIRIAVLLPFSLSLLQRKRYELLLLPVLAETCLVWTGYGVGWCFLTTALWIAVKAFSKIFAGKKGGES